MNPSAQGWINKYGHLYISDTPDYDNFRKLYENFRETGFIYGFNHKLAKFLTNNLEYSNDEIAKINLLVALHETYKINRPNSSFKDFVNELSNFYSELEISKMGFWKRLLRGESRELKLEGYINDRVIIDKNILTRHFNKTITNALLFIDVLTFKASLKGQIEIRQYAQWLESAIIQISLDASYMSDSNGKKIKGNDYSLLFKGSYYYSKSKIKKLNNINPNYILSDLRKFERKYLLDLAAILCYSDLKYSEHDIRYLHKLGDEFNFKSKTIENSIESVKNFYRQNDYFNKSLKQSDPISNFYGNSSKIAAKLVRRNFKRILQELNESKELLVLLNQARYRDLTKEEHSQIQEQLFDIFKSIPSLALFVLPGGMLLLPIVAKILPNMLPSSFDDNKIRKSVSPNNE